MSDSQRPHGLQPSRLLRPWDFPGKSPGVGCHCLLRTAIVTCSYLFDFGPFRIYLLNVLKLLFFLTFAWSQNYLLSEVGFFCHFAQIASCSLLYEKNSSRELSTVASTFAKPDCKWEVQWDLEGEKKEWSNFVKGMKVELLYFQCISL